MPEKKSRDAALASKKRKSYSLLRLIPLGIYYFLFLLFPFTSVAQTLVMVDFGANASGNSFGYPGWNTVIKGPSTAYSSAGPGGMTQVSGSSTYASYCGIKGSPRYFSYGERIIVTWYNCSSLNITFIPQISFDDLDQPVNKAGQPQWYVLGIDALPKYSGITIKAGRTLKLYYDIYNGSHNNQVGISEGMHSVINVCPNVAAINKLICDKIELNNDSVDVTPPTKPTNLSASAISHSRIRLSWKVSKDNIGVNRYRVYRDGAFIFNSRKTFFTDTGLQPDTKYTYTVMAIDDYGNRGAHSDSAFATTQTYQESPSLINPYKDIEYLGAFRVPGGRYEDGIQKNFNYAGYGMTYYPEGDRTGPNDRYPGSIFAVGHVHNCWVAEYNIPEPIISPTKNVSELNRATLLQDFQDIFTYYSGVVSIPTPGLEYLPMQGSQTTDKLYLVDASNFNWKKQPTHGWCELDLTNPQTRGPWYIGSKVGAYGKPAYYQYARYIFSIPETWAKQYVPHFRLISGCCRNGGQSGGGPTMYAFGPWNSGNPPPVNAKLNYQVLLQYDVYSGDPNKHYPNYLVADSWSDGAWLTVDGKSAVLISGQKGFGEYWYGYKDGTRHDNMVNKSVPPLRYLISGSKGGKCNEWKGQFVFYNPDDLASVVNNKKASWKPRPYAVLNIDGYLYHYSIRSIAYDRARSILYASEQSGDGDAVLVHVWKIGNIK